MLWSNFHICFCSPRATRICRGDCSDLLMAPRIGAICWSDMRDLDVPAVVPSSIIVPSAAVVWSSVVLHWIATVTKQESFLVQNVLKLAAPSLGQIGDSLASSCIPLPGNICLLPYLPLYKSCYFLAQKVVVI